MFAELMIEAHIMDQKRRSVCVREIQKSLNQSVKRLLETKIQDMNAGAYFEVQEAVIKSKKGDGAIIFQGMQNHTADSIKSLEGYDCAWVEEAQSLSQTSLDLLRPTIRKPESELSVNPPEGVVNIDSEWFYEESTQRSGVSSIGLDENLLKPANEEERKSILDLFSR
jgi:phage terminase large subunit